MSLDQANAFRDYVAQHDDVQREIRSALMTESAKISEIAAKHGFSFTSEEGEQAWESAQGAQFKFPKDPNDPKSRRS